MCADPRVLCRLSLPSVLATSRRSRELGHPLLRSREEGKTVCPSFSLDDRWAQLSSGTLKAAPLEVVRVHIRVCLADLGLSWFFLLN
jgi:hypothetical protein